MQNTVEVLQFPTWSGTNFLFPETPADAIVSFFSFLLWHFFPSLDLSLGKMKCFPMSAESIDYSMQNTFLFLPFSTQQLSLFLTCSLYFFD